MSEPSISPEMRVAGAAVIMDQCDIASHMTAHKIAESVFVAMLKEFAKTQREPNGVSPDG